MSKRICGAIVGLLLIYSCNKTPTNLPLTDDTAKNNEIIKTFIPSGTLASSAIKKMEHEGFSCKIMQDEKARSPKEAAQSNRGSKVDFVWCERMTGMIFSRRWKVVMSLDSEDKIENVSITMGL